MDEEAQKAIIAEVLRRRKIAIEYMVENQRKNRTKRRIWSHEWLKRRDEGKGVLSMLFKELRLENPKSFRNYTRMTEDIFEELLQLVAPHIKKQDTVMRQAISATDRLAVTLRYLATGNTFKDLSFSTRISPRAISIIVDDTCKAIIEKLEDLVFNFPTTPAQWELISDRFQGKWQFPHCIGALDGKHIAFRPPRSEGSKFRNYKGSDSIVLMAMVDADYRFIFADIGRNGRMHDSSVFRMSALGQRLESGTLNLPAPSRLHNFEQKLPYVIIADDAFALMDNLMKPYPHKNLERDLRIFSYRLSRARRVSENAFGILANKFRILLATMNLSIARVRDITYTCVLLHNFILMRGGDEWYVPKICMGQNPGLLQSGLEGIVAQEVHGSRRSALEFRDQFCQYFNTTGAVDWQDDAVARGNM